MPGASLRLLPFCSLFARTANGAVSTRAAEWWSTQFIRPMISTAAGRWPLLEGLVPVQVGEFWSYIDGLGKVVIKGPFNDKNHSRVVSPAFTRAEFQLSDDGPARWSGDSGSTSTAKARKSASAAETARVKDMEKKVADAELVLRWRENASVRIVSLKHGNRPPICR